MVKATHRKENKVIEVGSVEISVKSLVESLNLGIFGDDVVDVKIDKGRNNIIIEYSSSLCDIDIDSIL